MNIFILDRGVRRAAEQHHDAHVRKMLLEYTQLLCTAFPEPTENAQWPTPTEWKKATPNERIRANTLPYSRTLGQFNNACAVWTRTSRDNFVFVLTLAEALVVEFEYRFDKEHGSKPAIEWVRQNVDRAQVPAGSMTPHVLRMPEQYHDVDAVKAYRRYYAAEKRGYEQRGRWIESTWTHRPTPEWF